MIVLIDSHAEDRTPRLARTPAPDAGTRWGKAARFDFDRSDETEEMEARGGVTLIWPAEHIETVRVWDFTPVWRRYDVVRIESSADPTRTENATVTREMLIPLGSSTQRYVGGGMGYVEDPGDYGYEDRVIHSYLRLAVPSPVPEAEVIDSGVEGAWPDLPQEMFPPGRLIPVFPLPGAWDR